MRLIAVLAVVFLLGCSGAADSASEPPSGTQTPEEALESFLAAQASGQYGKVWDQLHPAQKKLVTRQQYEECGRRMPTFVFDHYEAQEPYRETVTIPGTSEEVEAEAVTYRALVDGEPYTSTNHMVQVDGAWVGYLSTDTLNACHPT
jgi:hypothetical protein